MLKLMSAFFMFHQNKALENYGKCYLFQLKCSFRYQDIQLFEILLFLFQRCGILRGSLRCNNLDIRKKLKVPQFKFSE